MADEKIISQPEEIIKKEVVEEGVKTTLKYNHEEKEYTEEEVKVLAQKGLNYDKVNDKLKSLESDKRLDFVSKLAKKNDMSVEQYLEAVESQAENDAIEEIAEKEEVSLKVAKKLYEGVKLDEQTKQTKKEQVAVQKENKDLADFVASYPDIKADQIPPKVWEDWNKGTNKSLIDAYMKHENKLMKDKLSNLEKNEVNENNSTGPVKGKGTTPEAYFSREQVDGMTQEETNKNYNAIIKSMKKWK